MCHWCGTGTGETTELTTFSGSSSLSHVTLQRLRGPDSSQLTGRPLWIRKIFVDDWGSVRTLHSWLLGGSVYDRPQRPFKKDSFATRVFPTLFLNRKENHLLSSRNVFWFSWIFLSRALQRCVWVSKQFTVRTAVTMNTRIISPPPIPSATGTTSHLIHSNIKLIPFLV